MDTELSCNNSWAEEKDISSWQVKLNTGKMVFEDDDRPGLIPSSWERLCLHCKETGEYPVNMWIRFRDHIENVGKDKEGYFFYKSMMHSPAWEVPNFYYITGFLNRGQLQCTKWKVPEIIIDEEFTREPPGGYTNVYNLPALIRKPDGVPTQLS